jgi:hypothetical protein
MVEVEHLVKPAKEAFTVAMKVDVLLDQFPWLTPGLAEETVQLAQRVQQHTCNVFCTSDPPLGQTCTLYFPRLPSCFTLVARLPGIPDRTEREAFLGSLESLHGRAQEVLRDLKRIGQVAGSSIHTMLAVVDPSTPQLLTNDGISNYHWGRTQVRLGHDLNILLDRCRALPGLTAGQVLRAACWHWSLLFRRPFRILPQRTIQEAWTVNYNPTVLLCTRANHDLDIIGSPEACFQYVTKGGVKTSSDSIHRAATELRWRGTEAMAFRLEQMHDNDGLREVSLVEAIYRMNRGLDLASSNTSVVYSNIDSHGHPDEAVEEENISNNDYTLRYCCNVYISRSYDKGKSNQSVLI